MDSPTEWLVFLSCAFGAQAIGTMIGFGSAMILTPIAFLFMEVKTAIAVVACFHLLSNASRLVFFGRHIDWNVWARCGLVAVVFSVAGAGMTARLSPWAIKFAFGLFLLLYVGISSIAPRRAQLPRSSATLIGGGVLLGFISGLLGTGGAIRSVCLLSFGLLRESYLGTSAAIAVFVDATRIPVYLAGRFIPLSMVTVVLSLVAVAFVGAWVGQKLVHKLPVNVFRWIVLAMLALVSIRFILEGLHGLA